MKTRRIISGFILFLSLSVALPSMAEEKVVEEGEHRGFIINDGEQTLRVSSVKPGQTLEVFLSPQWTSAKGGRVEWVLADSKGTTLRTGRHRQPEDETLPLEWTSNSEPRPNGYRIHIRGKGGSFAGEVLGQYSVSISLWDQNDGNSGTDAPESYAKALELPVSVPGNYEFDECFLSGTADLYDIYKISILPNHSLTLQATPSLWKGEDKKGKVRWEFLDRSYKRMKDGSSSLSETQPFVVKVFHPQVRSSSKAAIFYLLVKIEGEVSLIYTLGAEMKEGR